MGEGGGEGNSDTRGGMTLQFITDICQSAGIIMLAFGLFILAKRLREMFR